MGFCTSSSGSTSLLSSVYLEFVLTVFGLAVVEDLVEVVGWFCVIGVCCCLVDRVWPYKLGALEGAVGGCES